MLALLVMWAWATIVLVSEGLDVPDEKATFCARQARTFASPRSIRSWKSAARQARGNTDGRDPRESRNEKLGAMSMAEVEALGRFRQLCRHLKMLCAAEINERAVKLRPPVR